MLVVWVAVLVSAASTIAGGVKTSIVVGTSPCKGDSNATMIACPYPCPRTCSNYKYPKPCPRACPRLGCECNAGYVLSPQAKCILPEDCPMQCPHNAVYKQCPSPCQPTCENPSGIKPCTRACVEYGCECKRGFVLSKGKCIRLHKCPAAKYCSRNETFAPCKVNCPSVFCPVDDSRAQVACSVAYPCPPGCICKGNYRRLSRDNDKCILAPDCPPVTCTRPNEEWNPCPPNCLSERCDDVGKAQQACNLPYYCAPQCVCKQGFYRDDNDICVPLSDCKKCSPNAVYKKCPSPCPGTCDNPTGIRPCTRACLQYGCECNPGYVLHNGECIPLSKCPAAKYCSRNETFAACDVNCPSEYCPKDDSRAQIACSVTNPCRPGCICKADYRRVRNANNKCILARDCPPVQCTRPNEEWNSCPPNCLSESCDDIGKVQDNCTLPYYCAPQCVCKQGFYRDDSGICVSPSECKKCPPNSVYKKCPSPCPGTCDIPSGDRPCTRACLEYGCECNPGYFLSDGKCILLNECPAAKLCKRNETFTGCKVECPNRYCPVTDTRAILICDPPLSCRSGCTCPANYRRRSRNDPRCILASDCPALECTRPNEEWNSCPSNCLAERCDDVDKQATECNSPISSCNPKCVCKPGFYRNISDICVPASNCKKCTPNATYKRCPSPCTGTCENPSGTKPCPRACLQYGCECNLGYVLHNGECIPLSECPDKCPPNAVYKNCPSPCPGTCDYPSGSEPCYKLCVEYGCECKPGYVLSDGKCIPLSECPAAQYCNENEIFAACKAECPNSYCPEIDTTAIIACDPPFPCASGCICRENHRRLSQSNNTCVPTSDCPRLKCRRPNEVWNSCPSNCLAERCEDVGRKQTECNLPYSYCDPKCICRPGYYRNEDNICVPASSCPKKCRIKPECRPTCAVPNPPNCPYFKPPTENQNGCQCQEGYVLSNTTGVCIKVQECPANQGCNGDSKAVIKQCPLPCPSTCQSPNAKPCKRKCDPIGCECAAGYLLSEPGGKCIRSDECDGGDPCGTNEMFVQCRSSCPNDYCPVDDSLAVVICEYPPFSPCYSGCTCKLNHKRKSSEDETCIVSSDCPPVNCTRPHEAWNPCPEECWSGYCDSVDYVDYPCNTLLLNCQPKCTCEKNYFRNDSDVCITAVECREINAQNASTPPQQCGYNEAIFDCKDPCPPKTCESIFTSYACLQNATCESGCDCLDGCLRNDSGICVPSDECFTTSSCPISSECRATCAVPNPQNCPTVEPASSNEDGCQCQPGYVLTEPDGECVEIEKCPTNSGCNGDPNAVIAKCPWPCPSTCDAPNTRQCRKACLSVGCHCAPGYILSETDGRCILPDECPCGNPCGVNGTYSECGFRCPNQYCPDDDSIARYACKPGRPCPPGCLCKVNYKRRSDADTCVLAEDCPPVNCTRSNEVWNPCPECYSDSCSNINSSENCPESRENDCQPNCVCAKGYCRDEDDACVPAKECN